jgi:hypothetical protein
MIFLCKYFIPHCFICRPSDSMCRRTMGSNPGQLRLLYWLSDAQATWLYLIHNSATSHPLSATYHSSNPYSYQAKIGLILKKLTVYLCARDEPCCGNICRRLATPTPSSMWGATGSALSWASNRYLLLLPRVADSRGRRWLFLVLWIRDVYPGSRILIFTHPGSRIQKQQEKRGVKTNFLSYLFM